MMMSRKPHDTESATSEIARLRALNAELLAALEGFSTLRDWVIRAGGYEGALPTDVINAFRKMSEATHEQASAVIARAKWTTTMRFAPQGGEQEPDVMFATTYNHDGKERIAIELRVGDRVEWKRNGHTGSLQGEVKELQDKRVWLWLPDDRRYALVKPRFLSIHRNGRRLP